MLLYYQSAATAAVPRIYDNTINEKYYGTYVYMIYYDMILLVNSVFLHAYKVQQFTYIQGTAAVVIRIYQVIQISYI